MVISKFICIPLLIIVPLMILFFESRQIDFTVPPSDEELAQKVEAWKASRPSLRDVDLSATGKGQKADPNSASVSEVFEVEEMKKVSVEDATEGINLDISPRLNHFQGMKAERLKRLAKQLDPNVYPELVYLANERILDSAADSSNNDRHVAGEYIRANTRPIWNPEASLRVPMKVDLSVEESHYEKTKVLSPKLESAIFYGSGGTVEATVVVHKVGKGKSSISLIGKKTTTPIAFHSIPETESMIVSAIQLAVTNAIKKNKLPILHTDKIHYTYYTRLTWLLLAKSL